MLPAEPQARIDFVSARSLAPAASMRSRMTSRTLSDGDSQSSFRKAAPSNIFLRLTYLSTRIYEVVFRYSHLETRALPNRMPVAFSVAKRLMNPILRKGK